MDIKPVKDVQVPQYPRKEEVAPERIKVCIPLRWAKSPAAKIALGALAAMSLTGLAACDGSVATDRLTATDAAPGGAEISAAFTTEASVSQSPVISDILMGEAMSPTINVAPLFVHGDGLGAFGCVMVAPPAFLSEDEALAVINNVAKEYGLSFTSQGAPELENVLQPVTNIYESDNAAEPHERGPLALDFTDEAHGVAIEFVSVEDVKAWHEETGVGVSVETYATQDAAAQLSEGLEEAADTNFTGVTVGVLYDPCETAPDENGEDWENAEQQARTLSVEQLSAQVRDFCEWLQAQGII